MLKASSKNKVLLITNIPTPYRIPLFNELGKQLKQRMIKLKVIFSTKSYPRRQWEIDMSECKFDYEMLLSKKIILNYPRRTFFSYKGLYKIIKREKPDIIITIGFSISTTKLWLRSLFFPTSYLIWTGSTTNGGRFRSFFSRFQRKLLAMRAKGFIVYGIKAKNYLISLGVRQEKIFIAINTVDTDFFEEQVRGKKFISFNRKKRLLYIGDLSPRKNVSRILKAIKKLSQTRNDFILDIVGDGQEKNLLKKFVYDHDLENFVKFHGFKQKPEIPHFLAQADCFLFQTDFDIWGLVLVEAMASGLPCIASVFAGATHDLIIDGVTGFAIDFSETDKVAEKINWIFENPNISEEIGKSASKFIKDRVSLKNSVDGFIEAIDSL